MLEINKDGYILADNIHKTIESKLKNFPVWLSRKIHAADLKEGKDFITNLLQSTGGRPKTQYWFTLDAAKEICLLEQNHKGKEIRRWLISLSKQKEEHDLLTHDQVIYLSKLKAVFSFISECKKAEQINLDTHVKNSNSKNPFAEFHKMRNDILKLDSKVIDERLKQYCIDNQRLLPKSKSKVEKLIVIDKYEVLRNGVWDFLTACNEEQSLKLANLVKKMAEAENLAIKRVNDFDLLNNKIELPKLK